MSCVCIRYGRVASYPPTACRFIVFPEGVPFDCNVTDADPWRRAVVEPLQARAKLLGFSPWFLSTTRMHLSTPPVSHATSIARLSEELPERADSGNTQV